MKDEDGRTAASAVEASSRRKARGRASFDMGELYLWEGAFRNHAPFS